MGEAAYRLGDVVFVLSNAAQAFLDELDSLIPRLDVKSVGDFAPISIDWSGRYNVRELFLVVLQRHVGMIWIDAGALLSPANKKYLIVGRSSAGKSTLTMSMALGHGWKVISEDVLLIDFEKNRVLTLATPFSFKSGTKELLQKAIGFSPNALVRDEWLPLAEFAAPPTHSADFDHSILLGEKDLLRPLKVEIISADEMVRGMMGCSNLLRFRDAPTQMRSYLSSGSCAKFGFGTLNERIDELRKFDEAIQGA